MRLKRRSRGQPRSTDSVSMDHDQSPIAPLFSDKSISRHARPVLLSPDWTGVRNRCSGGSKAPQRARCRSRRLSCDACRYCARLYGRGVRQSSFEIDHDQSADFAGNARVGNGLEARVDIQKFSRRLVFANAFLMIGSERIARASAVFARNAVQEGSGGAETRHAPGTTPAAAEI